jgi:hypothetical protein
MKKILLITAVLMSFQVAAGRMADNKGHTIAYTSKQGHQTVIISAKGVIIGRYNPRTHKLYNKQGKIISGIK